MHEFAFGATSVNPPLRAVATPGTGRESPGSSGGSAAALASSFALLTLGTDTGGSIRILRSLRHSRAQANFRADQPVWGISCAGSLDHPGPMAKSVEDLALAMNVWPGRIPDPATPGTRPRLCRSSGR
jgi:aspartyl-tRNA(Asn)/glutamyl-tRNA(Gln) amidotransferase subunit A